MVVADVDGWLAMVRKCQCLPERDLRQLCAMVKAILIEESNVQPVNSPVTVCGDIHGQFYDLLELFRKGGQVPDTSYIFMGDFVDRGYHSVETLQLLLVLKARYPSRITLLRGNHESRQVTQVYGFFEECVKKYGNANAWRYCTEVFDYLNLAAVVDDQIQSLKRVQEIPNQGAFCDIMWSDPEDIDTWKVSPRGAGWLFGSKVTQQFNQLNGLELICRAHQLVQEGYKYMFPERNLITVWSAPNYCYRCGNVASILAFDEHLDRQVIVFRDTPESRQSAAERSAMSYFY